MATTVSNGNDRLRKGNLRRRRPYFLGTLSKDPYLVSKNNSFARPARAFHILVHFFAVLAWLRREIIKFEVM